MSTNLAGKACLLACLAISFCSAHADVIESTDITALSSSTTGTGSSILDLELFKFSGSEVTNSASGFNGDNGNNTLPVGGGADTGSFAESYITTGGELQDFYLLNFSDGSGGSTVNELAIFLNLNETGQSSSATNLLEVLDIVVSPTTVQGNPDASLDVSSAEQAAINQVYTGGTLSANLNSAFNLPTVTQGAALADYVIFTGINPFQLSRDDTVLFNVSMSSLNNGSEELFLSGLIAAQDVVAIPEPSVTFISLFLAAGMMARRNRKRNH